MSRFIIEDTSIEGLQIIQRQPIGDDRGYLERLFCTDELAAIIGIRNIVQINHTMTSKAGTVRGMHYQQPPHAEMKLVSCVCGEVFDVAVDLREDSPTFLRWHAEVLSESNHKTFVIPEGFAHGFQTFTENCKLLYLHTAAYEPKAEAGLNALDDQLSVKWPLSITERSLRDQQHAMLAPEFSGLSV
ncbi:dTDP-4-dehydrorhamnose 3,5-epimerase family protein [Opitutales bacterium]|nr:dTDP-4-dehydrorhamnose 3,5-epimerase family protein [Opitutales bacterium]